jgi:hypothetical protein
MPDQVNPKKHLRQQFFIVHGRTSPIRIERAYCARTGKIWTVAQKADYRTKVAHPSGGRLHRVCRVTKGMEVVDKIALCRRLCPTDRQGSVKTVRILQENPKVFMKDKSTSMRVRSKLVTADLEELEALRYPFLSRKACCSSFLLNQDVYPATVKEMGRC